MDCINMRLVQPTRPAVRPTAYQRLSGATDCVSAIEPAAEQAIEPAVNVAVVQLKSRTFAQRTIRPRSVVLVSGALVTTPARFDPHDDQDTPDGSVCWQILRIS